MKRLTMYLTVLTLLLVLANPAIADRIYMKSGDMLTGTIERLNEDRVTINTSYAGTLEIQRDQLQALETTEPVTVLSSDGVYFTGRIVKVNGTMKLELMHMADSDTSPELRQTREFTLDEIQDIYRGDPRELVRERLRAKLSGHVNAGLTITGGNTEDESYHFDSRVQARTLRNRYTVRLEYNEEKTGREQTEKNFLGTLKYDHFLSEKWFFFNSASFERDDFSDLNLRTNLGAGLGYQVFEEPDRSLSLEFGAAYVDENFIVAGDQSTLAGRYGIDYMSMWFPWMEFFHYQEGLAGPKIDFILTTRTGLRFPVPAGFNTTVQYNVDWRSNPPPGTDTADTKFLLTLGYSF